LPEHQHEPPLSQRLPRVDNGGIASTEHLTALARSPLGGNGSSARSTVPPATISAPPGKLPQ
jgi:hypothetical protein